MNASFRLRKARTALLFAAVLVIAGVVPVLYLAALFVWQVSMLFQAGSWIPLPATLLFSEHAFAFIPQFHAAWAAKPAVASTLALLHVGLIPALFGCAIAALGALSALRQRTLIRAHRQQNEDRLRRTRDYRRDADEADAFDSRREPFIGPGGIAIGPGGIARSADRHAA